MDTATRNPVGTTLELLRALIARRSLTPHDDGCQALLVARLEQVGFRCETLASNGVTNLWARRGTARPLVCFAGHTNVVPTGPLTQWQSDPFEPTERDGWLYGRGAADMKASLAAFVTGIETFLRAHPDAPGSITLLITSDEEGPSIDGTAKVVAKLAAGGETIDYCIVGEPSSVERLGDMIKNGRRGTLSGTLTIKGLQGHIAYPHLAHNPIHAVAPALAELATMKWDDGNAYFPATAWQCSNIHAGTGAANVIPGTLELMFNFRHSTASTQESLRTRFEEVLERHGVRYDLRWTGSGPPFLTPDGRLVQVVKDAVRTVTGVTPELSCTGGTSDGRFIAAICKEIVELGPVNATIHKIDERVAIADLEPLAAIYRTILEQLLLPDAIQASSRGVGAVIRAAGPSQGANCAPSGGVGAVIRAAGPSQGANCAPSGGVGVVIPAAGPPQGANCAPLGGVGVVTS